MWTRGRVTLARSGCGHISLVQEQSRQHARKDCSTKVSDDRNKSSRCNALQAAENSISKAQPLQMAARAKEAVARYGDRRDRHRLQATNLPPSGWGRHLTPTLKAPGQQAMEVWGACAIKLG